ncbi:MAG: DNA mismatch repair endonuclease MutL [Lachnospiraceae bacterium]|nr:DNA mismatch repair endonuclease MutL [Lachnospiraceae bacterium]
MADKTIIHELSQDTIDKIAAGEVVERPASIVKELVENAIDAGASAITVEIRDGGTSLIRVTDNGVGIAKEDVPRAFLRHATSKIESADDLSHISSLGFRGEALSSIAAVAKVEMITKRGEDITAAHYVIEGAKEVSLDVIGAPEGTSIFVRQVFYNTPARRKFLKSPTTEGNYITEIVERLALSNPSVSFRYLSGGTEKLVTAGNGRLSDTIFEVYGRQIAKELLPVELSNEIFSMKGFIGTPAVHRGNRAFESFFVGGRFVKSRILQKAVEEGYEGFLMQHAYPFCVLFLSFADETCDVNVHPTKQDVRFFDERRVYDEVCKAVHEVLGNREDIADTPVEKPAPRTPVVSGGAEPFETNRLMEMKRQIAQAVQEDSPYTPQYEDFFAKQRQAAPERVAEEGLSQADFTGDRSASAPERVAEEPQLQQLSFLSEEAKKRHRIIGQVFDTFWIVEYDNAMYIIDQHAAHEKVLYERFMERLANKEMTSQMMSPPQIVTLSLVEEEALRRYDKLLLELGFSVSHFGGKEYAIDAIPGNLYNIDAKELFSDVIATLAEKKRMDTDELIKERIASMSCKAAVKANDHLSFQEVESLINELLTLENPYHCPHGRPTIISMSRYELDKRFKRIV